MSSTSENGNCHTYKIDFTCDTKHSSEKEKHVWDKWKIVGGKTGRQCIRCGMYEEKMDPGLHLTEIISGGSM